MCIDPPFPLQDAGGAAIQFSHHRLHIDPFRNAVTVPAVGTGYHVLVREMGADPDRNRLLARIQMHEPRNAIRGKLLPHPFFKLADGRHPLVDFKQLLFWNLHISPLLTKP